MANELIHKAVGTVLTQVEFEATDSHALNSQATGDIIYASSSTQLSRLAKGSDNTILTLSSNIPAWTATPTLTSVAAGTIDATTDFTIGTTVITDDVITFTPTSSDTVTLTAATNGAFSLVTVDAAAAAANVQITADGTVDIDSAGALTLDSGAAINIEPAAGSVILLDGVLTVDAGVVAPVATAHNAAGTAISISAGDTTAGTTNNIAGGALTIQGGQGKGSGAGGDIIFQTANAGGSGSSINALATALTISDDLSTTFAGIVSVDATTESTSTVTGSIHTDGGLGVAGDVILGATSTIFLGDTANANMTAGITLNQGAADNEIFALKSSDTSHAETGRAEADTFLTMQKYEVAAGGVEMRAFNSQGTPGQYVGAAFHFWGFGDSISTLKTSAANAPFSINTSEINGSGGTAPGANANLAVIRAHATTRFIFDAEGTMHSIGATYTDSVGDGLWFVNDTANAGMTVGLSINQGAADNEILALKSSDVAHGVTSLAETDTFAMFRKEDTDGGLQIAAFGRDAGGPAIKLRAVSIAANAARTTAATAPFYVWSSIKDGTSDGTVGADKNMMVIADRGTGRFIFDSDGSGHADVEWVAFDTHDDLALMDAIQREATGRLTPMRYGHNPLYYHREYMEDIGIVGKDSWHTEDRPDGTVQERQMVNFTKLAMLHHGAILQIGDAIKALETENRELKALIGR